MNYTLHQLQIFLQVAQAGSITKAAEQLHLTQPAVSIQLKKFQEQFDIPLTEVVSRRLYVTDFGKEIAEAAEKIINEAQAITFRSKAHQGLLTGKLRITIVSTAKYVMPYFLNNFIKRHPGVTLKMDVTNKAKVIRSLEANEVDFSLVSILPTHLNIDAVPLMKNQLFLVGNNERHFPKKRYGYELFKDLPLVYREPGSGTRATMEEYIRQHNLPVLRKLELTSNEAVKQAVLAGLGFSIMPLIGLRDQLITGTIQVIPVKGLPVTTTWNLIWNKQKNFSPVASAFLEYIKDEKERIIREQFSWYQNFEVV